MTEFIRVFMAALIGGIPMVASGAESQDGYYEFPEDRPEAKFVPPLKAGQSEAEYYRAELTDLYKLDTFRAMKNSYVLGLETFCMLPRRIPTGGRYTLLDVEGQGSLRHIWETRGPDTSEFEFEMFIDGETEPSIKGTFPDLIAAAQRAQQRYVLNPGGTIPKLSHNFYLPVPFEKSLRIDIADFQDDNGLVFLQLDYRLDDDSMAGTRLRQKNKAEKMILDYDGTKNRAVSKTGKLEYNTHTIKGNGEFEIEGSAIIRRFAVDQVRPGVRMNIFFDDEPTPAIEVDIADFFGPFKGSAFEDRACYLPMPLVLSHY